MLTATVNAMMPYRDRFHIRTEPKICRRKKHMETLVNIEERMTRIPDMLSNSMLRGSCCNSFGEDSR